MELLPRGHIGGLEHATAACQVSSLALPEGCDDTTAGHQRRRRGDRMDLG